MAIILMGKRELVAVLYLSSWCLVMIERLFLTVPWGFLGFLIVVFPDHTHFLVLLMVDFLQIFQNIAFSKFFEIFEIHQYFLVKLLNALNFI